VFLFALFAPPPKWAVAQENAQRFVSRYHRTNSILEGKEFEVGCLSPANTRSIENHQDGAMHQIRRSLDHRRDFFGTEHNRELLRLATLARLALVCGWSLRRRGRRHFLQEEVLLPVH